MDAPFGQILFMLKCTWMKYEILTLRSVIPVVLLEHKVII